jgi:arsenical pump membrane protein
MTVLVFVGLALLVAAVAWRPHGWGPTIGAMAAVGVAALGGAVHPGDIEHALSAQWRAYVTLASVMTMTATAERLGLIARLAAVIEPRTRGPVRRAFLVTYVLSALVAAMLSNDAAILLMTPTVIVLIRTVYPRRNPKFLAPFVLAVFASAGVAPLVISNPMNLIFAEHVGIGFNEYAVHMIPVAIAGWLVAYLVLAWAFRDVLDDPAPALGAWPDKQPLTAHAWFVLVVVIVALCAYPVASYLGMPLWPIAATGAALCMVASLAAGHPAISLVRGIAWTLFPFLLGVFVLAVALERVGVVDWLRALYATDHPMPVIGAASAIGSAVLNNHPMSVLNAFALDGTRDPTHAHALAALVGGDLGPRLLPVGSLASLLWYDLLRRHGVVVRVTTFIRIGVLLTIPTLAVSLLVLWLTSP